MSKEARTYQSYANFVKRLLVIAGLWPEMGGRYAAYWCISVWSLSCCFIQSVNIAYGCTKFLTNIALLTLLLGPLTTMSSIAIKGFHVFWYRKKVQLVNNILDPLLDEILKEPRYQSIAFPLVNTFYRLIFIEGVLLGASSFLHALKSLLGRVLDDGSSNTTRAHYPLPLHGFYPWSLESPTVWYLHYFFEANICFFLFFISTGVDAFFGFCMFRISAMLRVLGVQFEALSRQRKNDVNHRKMFVDCVEKHNSLIKCRNMVQEIYGPIILLITVLNAICICTLIFQLLQVNGIRSNKSGLFTIYVFLKFIQTFIYAWPGCVIITESEFFRDKAYCSEWYENDDTSFTKFFTMILIQRPMVVRACCICQVSLDLFVKVINTSISYYFLLQTLDSEK